jgi:hypothetical protein
MAGALTASYTCKPAGPTGSTAIRRTLRYTVRTAWVPGLWQPAHRGRRRWTLMRLRLLWPRHAPRLLAPSRARDSFRARCRGDADVGDRSNRLAVLGTAISGRPCGRGCSTWEGRRAVRPRTWKEESAGGAPTRGVQASAACTTVAGATIGGSRMVIRVGEISTGPSAKQARSARAKRQQPPGLAGAENPVVRGDKAGVGVAS